MTSWHHWGKILRHWLQNPSLYLFAVQSQFSGRGSLRNQATSPSCAGHGILPIPTHTQDMCAVNHRISKSSSPRRLTASHMRLSKTLVRRAIICYRPALEFIFICQNADVNVQRGPLSLGAKEADPLVFSLLCPTSLLFSFLLGVSYFDMIMHFHSNIPIRYSPPSPAKPHLFSLCVFVCVYFIAFLAKCFSAQIQ